MLAWSLLSPQPKINLAHADGAITDDIMRHLCAGG